MKDAVSSSSLHARVTDAPALCGVKMYQVKISCKGKSTTMYKSKEDFRNVINMFKLVGAMAKNKDAQCEVCATCSTMPMIKTCDEESLNAFLGTVLDKLRGSTPDALEECGQHKGIIQILMEFLSVRHGKHFCDQHDDDSSEQLSPESPVQENELDHPIAHCSLNRTLSQRFAAMDSVC
ncbi:hypothetical protein FI667_g9200, partial [Globisporangium splendens]